MLMISYRKRLKVFVHRLDCHVFASPRAQVCVGSLPSCAAPPRPMKYTLTLHPHGLDPKQAAKAGYLRVKCKEPWEKVRLQTRTVRGDLPGKHTLRGRIRGVSQFVELYDRFVTGFCGCLACSLCALWRGSIPGVFQFVTICDRL